MYNLTFNLCYYVLEHHFTLYMLNINKLKKKKKIVQQSVIYVYLSVFISDESILIILLLDVLLFQYFQRQNNYLRIKKLKMKFQ